MRLALSLLATAVLARGASVDPKVLNACPGYAARNVRVLNGGRETQIDLNLRSRGCNVFGQDIERLRLTVTYETATRLHVKIVDASKERYEVPEDIFPRPSSNPVTPARSDLAFKYTTDPFSFTVSRRLTGEVLFSTVGHPIIFEDQYLRIKTNLPRNPNIYGFGEHTETFRLDPVNGGRGMTRTLWSRDSYGIPNGTNLYGNHPVYFEHRLTGTHGVFLLNSNGMDVKLNQTSTETALEYNVIGGVLDFYFLAGSVTDPEATAKQYAEISGLAAQVPYWGLGFHQCRFGYKDYVDVASVITRYERAGIPLETMWTDIDYMDRRLIFTLDPQYFPLNRMREIVDHLHNNNQHFIVMTDPAVGVLTNEEYGPLERGEALGVWMKNRNGSNHLGVVWPGVTVFPDWFHPKTEEYWTGEFARFYNAGNGLNIDGAWIDMNEPASFCEYPCNDPWGEAIRQTMPPPRMHAPPRPDVPIFGDAVIPDEYLQGGTTPARIEAPNAVVITSTDNKPSVQDVSAEELSLLEPPYAIDNAVGPISSRTAYTSVIHANGLTEYDTHNLYGSMMSSFTRRAMLARRPNRRPLVITRSTFAGAGREVGKWLGDNFSTWDHYRNSIAQMLNFASIFNVPMVGSDTCGFAGNTTEVLCARWAMLGAFNPFYRNHNGDTSISQEFYIWPATTEAGKAAVNLRYRLLDYIYTALEQAHRDGTPVLSPLWYKYPKDRITFPIDLQFFYGPSLLVSPITEDNANSVTYYLPLDIWYEFATLSRVARSGRWITQGNIGYAEIPLHIKGGSIIPLRSESAMTTTELRTKPFDLVVAPNLLGQATGSLYLDDGETINPPASATTNVQLQYRNKKLTVGGSFGYKAEAGVAWKTVRVAGVERAPRRVTLNGRALDAARVRYTASTKVLEADVNTSSLTGFELQLD